MLEPIAYHSSLRILIVDDDHHDVALLRRSLEPHFVVNHASSLHEANKRIREVSFDCVLLDLKLPDSHNSKRTVEEFVADNPGLLCIVVTGSVDEREHSQLIKQGADDVWVKGKDTLDMVVVGRRLREAIWRWKRQKKSETR
jgi:DNA-binding NtrC family response regulator